MLPLNYQSGSAIVKQSRIDAVDIVRGVAICGVVIFHMVWDLEFTGIISGVAFHPIWLGFGRILAGTFMFLVGYSLVLAHPNGVVKKGPFLRRLSIISAAALAITLITFFAFPTSFIFFGILHSIAIASLLGIVFLKTPAIVPLVMGILVLAFPQYLQIDAFENVSSNFEKINNSIVDSGCNFSRPHLIPLFLPFLALPSVRILSSGIVDVKKRSYITPIN